MMPPPVELKNAVMSRRATIIGAQHPTEALASLHPAALLPNACLWGEDLVVETLMSTLGMAWSRRKMFRTVMASM